MDESPSNLSSLLYKVYILLKKCYKVDILLKKCYKVDILLKNVPFFGIFLNEFSQKLVPIQYLFSY